MNDLELIWWPDEAILYIMGDEEYYVIIADNPFGYSWLHSKQN